MKPVPFAPLEPALYRELVRRALAEDLGWGDVTTNAIVPEHARARGHLVAKAPCVVAGVEVSLEAFRQLDPGIAVDVHKPDSSRCALGDIIATFVGAAGPMLTAERTALNFLQRMSGIATLARQFVDAATGRIIILDTRKTTPNVRILEKYAVRAGGATNHRMGLDDGILIKDNHKRLAGSVQEAWRRMRAAKVDLPIEVEVETLEELEDVLAAGADFVLLDNFTTPQILKAVDLCKGRAKIEISGGVTLARLPELAATGADYVSVGALTHSATAIDISFEMEPL